MRISNLNRNRWKPVKPISRMNQQTLKGLDMKRRLANSGIDRTMGLKPTAGLALNLADKANRYSKMKVQLEA